MTEPTPEVHNEHSGQIKINWPDPGAEPRWNDQRVRAVALELAIKATDGQFINESIDSVGESTVILAERYHAFITGENVDG